MKESPDQIKAKLVSNGHTTKVLDPDNFNKSTDVLNGQNFRFDFNNGYELWYYGTEDKLVVYQGFAHIFTIYSQDIKTETMDYINFLKGNPSTGVATSTESKISDSLYCDCSSPKIEKTLLFNVDYFDLCTNCKKEYQKSTTSGTSWFLNY